MSFSGDNSDSGNEDNESFHSFNSSESYNDHLSTSLKSESESDLPESESELEHETTQENLNDAVLQPTQPVVETPKMPFRKPELPEDLTSESSGTESRTTNHHKSPKNFAISPLIKNAEPVRPWLVPELPSNLMPNEDLFDLDAPPQVLKEHLEPNHQTEVLQKYAFTEIWVDSQQIPAKPKRSPLKDFSVALEAYFNKNSMQQKGDISSRSEEKENVMESKKATVAHPNPIKTVEKYVSPLPPPVPSATVETPLLKGAKKPITVPGGFDLSRLVEIKNPNHWACRPHMRTGDSIY